MKSPRALHWLRQRMGYALPADSRQGFHKSLYQNQFWPTMLVGILVMIFEAGMILATILRQSRQPASHTTGIYLTLYAVLFLFTLVCISSALVFRSFLNRHPGIFLIVSGIYGLFICLWGSLLTAYSHRDSTNISVFIYVCLCVSIIVNYRPWMAVLLYGLNLVCFYLLMFHFISPQLSMFGSVLNSLIVTLLCMTISSILYRNRAANYLNRNTILQQNQQIQHINEQLRDLVMTDNLTSVYNRRYFDEVAPGLLDELRQDGAEVCLMMLDIDLFKQYNDIYGHPQGDVCLQAISGELKRRAGQQGGACIRYGGEEFVLLLPVRDSDDALARAEAARAGVQQLGLAHTGSPWETVTISAGIYTLPPGAAATLPEMLQYADQALYAAKNAGRNRVLPYGPGMSHNPVPASASSRPGARMS